jgi:hypothetical protein
MSHRFHGGTGDAAPEGWEGGDAGPDELTPPAQPLYAPETEGRLLERIAHRRDIELAAAEAAMRQTQEALIVRHLERCRTITGIPDLDFAGIESLLRELMNRRADAAE